MEITLLLIKSSNFWRKIKMSKLPQISNLEKYKILLQPDLSTADIRLLNAVGIGKGIEIRVQCENLILQEGYMLLANKRVNTWAYMKMFGLEYEQFERIPEVNNWLKENRK